MTIRFVKNLFAVGVLAAVSAISAVAQSTALQVNVPFAFVVNGVKMSAGSYVIQKADETGVFMIRGSQSAIVQTNSSGNYTNMPDTPGLSFERNAAGEPVLTKVHLLGEPTREVVAHTPVVKAVLAAK